MPHDPGAYPRAKIFALSAAALFTAGMSFVVRGGIIGDIEREVLVEIDPAASATLAGSLLGVAFTGFGATLLLGSTFLAWFGMGRMLLVCGLCFAGGTGLVIASDALAAGAARYDWMWWGFLVSGLGWGLMEASVNPLTAALYPEQKTAKLNEVHAWWPAGQIVGGLCVLGVAAAGLGWRTQFALVIAPALVTVGLCIGTTFPTTERAAMGVPMAEMLREILRRPMFLVWWACMLLTAAVELAPGQWIDLTLTRTVGMRGIWLLIYVAGMMFVFRHFAGPIAHRISNLGILWASSFLTIFGLLALSVASSPLTGLAAATLWGLGVCFLWPTMLANVSERYPRGGELFVGLMGVAGALSISFVLPALGRIFDRAKHEIAGGEAVFGGLEGAARDAVLGQAAATSFQTLAFVPVVLVVVFGAIAFSERRGATRRGPEADDLAPPPSGSDAR